MKRIVLLILMVVAGTQLVLGQGENSQLTLTKEFIRRVFDMQPFDSIAKYTTLRKDLPLARFKYSSAYLATLFLQLQIQDKKYHYLDLSYIPYLALSGRQRTLVYDKSAIDGSQNNKDLSAIYAVYSGAELVTYVELKNGKVSGIRSIFNPGADYIHSFAMNDIDTVKSIIKLEEKDRAKVQINN